MIVLQILMLIFCMVILPFGIGVLPGRWLKKEDRTLTGIWISGYLVLFALFELVGIPVVLFTVYHGFSRLCLIFGLLAGVGFLAGVVRLLKKKEDYSSLLEGSFLKRGLWKNGSIWCCLHCCLDFSYIWRLLEHPLTGMMRIMVCRD